jgi:spermidine/putrescine transport system ATP-binding protein
MGQAIVTFNNICKHFGDHLALDHVNLAVQNGEFLTLLGPSGCGKTTLLRILGGFEWPDEGQVAIHNRNVTNQPPEVRQVNMVFQSYALFPHMTVYHNVAFGLECAGLDTQTIHNKVMETLKVVKLQQMAHRYPARLSGGQKQRVAIARAVIKKPLVLLLDEPLSALDYKLRKNMRIELKQLQRQLGLTFVFVTHDQEEALSMSDRVVVMDHGRIVQKGKPRDIYEEPNSLFSAKFIGEANVFEAVVQSADERTITLNVAGTVFQLANNNNYQTGDWVNIIVRPEDIRVWSPNEVQDTSNMIPGKVEQVIYKGSTVDLIVKLASGQRVAATEFFDEDDEDLFYETGETAWIRWIPGWEVVLPYEHST